MKYPLVSVIINVFNEEFIIERCLRIVRNQTYPQKNIEIILVDDNSTDATVRLAKPFNVKVVKSGYKNIERAKSIGIEYARGELILLLDADVFLESSHWIKTAVDFFIKYPQVAAYQSVRWKYTRKDCLVNRYCNLFGVNDPFVYFLKKRGALMATENSWIYPETIVKKLPHAWLVTFTPGNLPTMGAQGYMVRKKLIKKTSWKPYFFHLDTVYEMVSQGNNHFIVSLSPIQHLYGESVKEFYKKLYRNITLFLQLHQHRKYTYKVGKIYFLVQVLLMVTLLVPFYQSIKGYRKVRDIAWFLHPLFCLTVPILYTFVVIQYHLSKKYRTLVRNSI